MESFEGGSMDEVKCTHSWILGAFVGWLFYAILTRTEIESD